MDVAATTFPPLPAATRFAFIVNGLISAIGARFVERDRWSPGMILYVWDRIIRINEKFQRIAALIQAGKLPKEREYRPRPPKDPVAPPPIPDGPANFEPWTDAGAAADPNPGEPPARPNPAWPVPSWMWREFPQGEFGWLCRLMPSNRFQAGADVAALDLRVLLEDPEMRALLAATPRLRKLLRPLCWMLGLPTALLGEVPPRPRRRRRWRPAGPSKREIMAVINDRPGPIHGRGGPPLLPGEHSRGGFPARLVRAWAGKPPDLSRSGCA